MKQNGKAIKAIRLAKGISGRELARRIERDPGFLCHVEAGRCYASDQTLARIASEMNVDVEAITRGAA